MSRSPRPGSVRRSSPAAGGVRIDEFDALRGVAILLVLYLHSYFSPWAGVSRWELLPLRVVDLAAHAAVPLFLFMSGFLLARGRAVDFATYARVRARRIVVPLAIWMLAALAFETWRAGGLSRDLLQSFALFDIAGHFYYLLVLVILTLAAFPLRRVPDTRLWPLTAGAFALNLATVAFYSTQPIAGLFATIAYRNPLMWIFPFMFGVYLARTRGTLEFGRTTTLTAAFGMAIAAAVYLARGEVGGGYPTSYFGVSVFLFSTLGLVVFPACVRALARSAGGRVVLAPMRALAPFSFAIYLVHKPYFVPALSGWLLEGSALSHHYLALVLANLVVGGGLAIVSVVALNRIAPRFGVVCMGVEQPRLPARPVEQPGAA